MAVRIQLRRDTASNWSQNNPILRPGEVGIETDTLKFKIGPAVVSPAIGTAWNSISGYANVTPTSLSNSLTSYILAADQGKAGGPAELDANGDLLVPENEIILWNKDLYDYTTKIVATQPTADRTITLPDRSGTVITTGDTATVTNTMLAGSIANNKLANSSITINGFSIALGGEAAYSTDNIQEGGTNKYFSNELAQDATALALAAGTHTNITVTYDDANNAISLAAAPGYTNEEARDAVAGLITGSTHSGISVSYTDDGSNAGELSFTNTDKGSSQNIFKNIVVGATTVVADSNNDTLTIVGSNGVGALANATNDVIEIYNTGVTSLTGTANEVEVDTSTGAVIVGLPNNVTISGNLTLSNAPTQASHAATKAYVDNTVTGINFHAPAHTATTTNLAVIYDNGTNGVGATLTADTSRAWNGIDGHTTFNVGDRILVKNQTDATQNGMYTLTQLTAPWVLTRATDADNSPSGELAYGDFVFVQNGGQAGYGFIVNTTGTITIGSTNINYVQFNAGQVVVAGNGLTEPTAGTLAIDTAVTVDVSSAQTLTNKTITGTFSGPLTGNVTGDVTGNVSGNAGTVTNGVYTTGSYSNPSWITGLGWSKISSTPTTLAGYGITDALASSTAASTYAPINNPTFTGTVGGITKSMVGLGNVENTALSTWAGSANITTLGTVATGSWEATAIKATKGGTGLTTYASGDILYASATDNLSALAKGTNGQILTLASGLPSWADAPITLPSQTGNNGKYLTTDGTTASWATLVVPIVTGTATISSNTATTIDTNALNAFTSAEYMVSLKQGSKTRTSKVIVQTDGTSVDMTEFAITETGGTMSGVVVSATASAGNALLQVTVTDAASTNVTVKFSEVRL
jgi:Major tropism determinant N-terminal domain